MNGDEVRFRTGSAARRLIERTAAAVAPPAGGGKRCCHGFDAPGLPHRFGGLQGRAHRPAPPGLVRRARGAVRAFRRAGRRTFPPVAADLDRIASVVCERFPDADGDARQRASAAAEGLLRPARIRRGALRAEARLALRRRVRPAGAGRILGRRAVSRSRVRRSQGHVGAESPSALAAARTGLQADARSRLLRALRVGARRMDRREPTADRNELGQHARDRPAIDLRGSGRSSSSPLPPARAIGSRGWSTCCWRWIGRSSTSRGICRCYFSPNTHLTGEALAMYAAGQKPGGAARCARLGGGGPQGARGGSPKAGGRGWRTRRAVRPLPSLLDGFLPARAR